MKNSPLLGHLGHKCLVVGLLPLFALSLLWARNRDPFDRVSFKVKIEGKPDLVGTAILPKWAKRPLPIVIYCSDSDDVVLKSGNDARQMAELGLAVIIGKFDWADESGLQTQWTALHRYLDRQKWANPRSIAAVGFGETAPRLLSLALNNDTLAPSVLVGISGTWKTNVQIPALRVGQSSGERLQILLIQGEHDEVSAASDAVTLAQDLRKVGWSAESRIVSRQSHDLDPDRSVVFRFVGEYCREKLESARDYGTALSMLSWRPRGYPLLWFWFSTYIGILILLLVWFSSRASQRRGLNEPRLAWFDLMCRLSATGAALLILGFAIWRGAVTRQMARESTLSLARRHFVAVNETRDFDFLAACGAWKGQRLNDLLEYIHLSAYNRDLVTWKIDEETYRDFVLSPSIMRHEGELAWRHTLWQAMYLRVRREPNATAAAVAVVRFLRERVTISTQQSAGRSLADIWFEGVTNAADFECLYVAALRSVGVGARLGPSQHTELYLPAGWTAAPRPVL